MNERESERESEKARESGRERASERERESERSIYNEKFVCVFYGVCRLPQRLEFFVTSAQNLQMKGLLLAHVSCERKNDGLSLSLSHIGDGALSKRTSARAQRTQEVALYHYDVLINKHYSKPMTSMISTANSRRRLLLFDPAIANV